MDASKWLFRASSVGNLMVEPRNKTDVISETTKVHLIDIFIQKTYGRKTDINNRYTMKGTMVEEDSMTLYSRVVRKMFYKNEESLSNDFVCGTPDIITSLDIDTMEVIDLKSSWDCFTFFRTKYKGEINKMYYWQLQTYMALTGAKKSKLVYCLVNTPDQLLAGEKRSMWYKMGQPPMDSDLFVEACCELDASCHYDDIPMKDRVHEIIIERNNEDIDRLYKRVEECRTWIQSNLTQTPERIEREGT